MSLLDTTERRDLAAAAKHACESDTPWPRLLQLGLADLGHHADGQWITELAIIAAAYGAQATPGPLIGRVVAARTSAVSAGPLDPQLDTTCAANVWLPGRDLGSAHRDGSWTVTGAVGLVPDIDGARRVLVVADDRLFTIGLADAEITTPPSLDPGTSLGRLMVDDAPAELIADPDGWDREDVRTEAAVLISAVAAGASRSVVDDAVRFAGERFQFGRAIGSFQAVRHRLVDLTLAIDRAWTALEEAVDRAERGDPDARLYSTMAALTCTDVYEQVSAAAIQVYGGIGFTWEHPAHRHLKRARVLAELAGPRHQLLTAVADTVGLPA